MARTGVTEADFLLLHQHIWSISKHFMEKFMMCVFVPQSSSTTLGSVLPQFGCVHTEPIVFLQCCAGRPVWQLKEAKMQGWLY